MTFNLGTLKNESKFGIKNILTFSSLGNRLAQEDHVLVEQDKNIVIVADGFGGPIPGKKAAQLGSESIRDFYLKKPEI